MKRFVAIGECMVELSEAGGDLWRLGVAGDTLNAAWYARALLPAADWAVEYVTRVGTDPFSDGAVEFLVANGIDARYVGRHPTRGIGLYAISLDDGERSFTYWRDASAARTLAEDPVALADAMRDADMVHVSGITLAILPPEGRRLLTDLLAARARAGLANALDPNHRPRLWSSPAEARAALTAAAGTCSVLLPSFDDERALFGDQHPAATAKRYADLGARTVVVKNGGGAVVAVHEGRTIVIDDLPAVKPVDTTGAGDSFDAGLLAALVQGAGIEDAVRSAHALAAQVIAHPGALMPMSQIGRGNG